MFHLTIADTVISFITMPMETSWRIIIEVMALMMLRVHRMGKTILNVSVARWERGLQGFDDDPNWWIHPLLPNAHRPQCRQVHQHHHHLEYPILIPVVLLDTQVSPAPTHVRCPLVRSR